MSRPMPVFATLVLALAMVGVIAWGFQPARSVSTSDSPSGSETTARRFYDAANLVIATGDVSMFRAVVSPDFVDIEPLPGATSGRNGLESTLLDLHATMPGVQLEIEELVADGREVMVRIALAGNRTNTVLGIPVDAEPTPWGRVDVLLITGGYVAERRTTVDGTGRLSSLSSVPLGNVDPRRVVVTLERMTIQPVVGFDAVTGDNPHMLIAESADIQVERRSVNEGPSVASDPENVITLQPDALYGVPPGAVYNIRNTSREVASVLRLTLEWPAPGGTAMGPSANVDGVTFRTVAGGNAMLLPGGTLQATLGRIALAPGGTLSLSGFDGVALMEVVTGNLSVFADDESFKRRGTDGSGTIVMQPGLDSGDGLLVGSETPVVLRNEGTVPVTALLVTVTMDAP